MFFSGWNWLVSPGLLCFCLLFSSLTPQRLVCHDLKSNCTYIKPHTHILTYGMPAMTLHDEQPIRHQFIIVIPVAAPHRHLWYMIAFKAMSVAYAAKMGEPEGSLIRLFALQWMCACVGRCYVVLSTPCPSFL